MSLPDKELCEHILLTSTMLVVGWKYHFKFNAQIKWIVLFSPKFHKRPLLVLESWVSRHPNCICFVSLGQYIFVMDIVHWTRWIMLNMKSTIMKHFLWYSAQKCVLKTSLEFSLFRSLWTLTPSMFHELVLLVLYWSACSTPNNNILIH